MNQFAFALGQVVYLVMSKEEGRIVARAEYSENSNQYLVRYKTADGRQVENWWSEQSLEARDQCA